MDKVLFPLIFLILFIPFAQRIIVITLDFSFLRILILFYLFRIFIKKENKDNKSCAPDKWIFCWAVISILAFGLLRGDISAFVSRIGYIIDAVGSYYIAKTYIKGPKDVIRVVKYIGWLSFPILTFFLVERASGHNVFSVFGGVPEITDIREGRLRCQGPFSHPIMAGVLWASILPWIYTLWYSPNYSRLMVIAYTIAILLIIINTASSTPIMAIIFGVIGFAGFILRARMRGLVWLVFFGLIALHFAMEAPVWHLVSRIDVAGGSTGWHRYFLIDQAINRFGEWWLIGTLSTAHWGGGLVDVTNQYIAEAVTGGLLSLASFMLMIWSVFNLVGRAGRQANNRFDQMVIWSMGVILFVHCLNFIGVTYFGQNVSFFYLFLGMTVGVCNYFISTGQRNFT